MSSAAYTLLATSPRPRSSTPTQESMSEEIDLLEILRSGEDSRQRRYRPDRLAHDPSASPAVVLFCGADQDSTELDWDEHRPWVVEMLPETEPPPARKRQKRSNGCGARVHAAAVPDRRWRAQAEGASGDVVDLDDAYFSSDMKRELLMGKERCGCRRTGVGCAIWSVLRILSIECTLTGLICSGNPLGALFTPCTRHAPTSPSTSFSASHYTFLRAAVSPPLPNTNPSRRVSLPADDVRGEREALQRRIRDREELVQLRDRVRAVHQSHTSRAGAGQRNPFDPPEDFAGRRADRERERERRMQQMQQQRAHLAQAAGDDGHAAFEAWADATLQRATATAASDVPVVVDLSALMDLRASPTAETPEPAAAPTPAAAPRELSEEERRRDWQRGVMSAARRSLEQDWPTMGRRMESLEELRAMSRPAEGGAVPPRRFTLDEFRLGTIERTTALPQPESHSLDEVRRVGRYTPHAEREEEERVREEPARAPVFFNR
ncbi:hypothetical protein DFH06DRAFT_1462802 [Mycena polygramma]|nr:hypothetical protein DFH06DRAFT_1462802 [Mycena polygramma]